MAKINVDGIDIEVPDGTVLLEACKQAGIEIPHFCYYAKLTLMGACRMCLVEIDKMPKPQTSCTVLVRDGMVVRTNTPEVQKMRRAILEFLLLNHSLTCPTCDAGGECELQDNVFRYRGGESRMEEAKIHRGVTSLGAFIDKNMERCVQCYRCTRYCDEVMGVKALAMVHRGAKMEVASFNDQPLDCVLCGNCVEICPVGALTSNLFDYKKRPWERKQTRCICTYCGDGCSLELETEENRVFRTRGFLESGILQSEYRGVNDEFLCVKGRFGYQFLNHPQRLKTPLVRRGDELVPASWDEALEIVAEELRKAKSASPDAVGFIGSERCSNEANYLFQKLARAVVGTNNVDCRTRFKKPPKALPIPPTTPALREIKTVPAFLVIGANLSDENPLTETEIRMAVRRNSALLAVADPRHSLIVEDAVHFLRCRPGAEAATAVGMVRALFEAKQKEPPAFLAKSLEVWHPERLEQVTGVPYNDMLRAAEALAGEQSTLIMYGSGLLSAPGADAAVLALHAAAEALGWPGPYQLAAFNNTRGALDMGVLPDMLPGYTPLSDASAREALARLWGGAIPERSGLDVLGMLQAAASGKLNFLYIMGSNPAVSFPDGKLVSQALERVPFLVVQDIFLSETARYANVVLPACGYAEQDGTYTNSEGRIQRSFRALDPPGEARADTVIITQIAQHMGANWTWRRPEQLMEEISAACPAYKGVNMPEVVSDGVLWPRLNGRPAVPAPNQQEPAEQRHLPEVNIPDMSAPPEYPLALITGQFLFHSGSLSTWDKGLRLAAPIPFVQVHPDDAQERGLTDGDTALVESPHGSLKLTVKVTEKVPRGAVFVPVNFPEAPANILQSADAPLDYVRIVKA